VHREDEVMVVIPGLVEYRVVCGKGGEHYWVVKCSTAR